MARRQESPPHWEGTTFVFRIGTLGDTLVALPAIQWIARNNANRELVLITDEPAAPGRVSAWDVLRHTGKFSRHISYAPANVFSLLRIASAIIRARSPVVYHLCPARPRILRLRDKVFFAWMCRAKTIGIDFAAPPARRDSSNRLVRMKNESVRLLELVSPRPDASAASVRPMLRPAREDKNHVDALLRPLSGFRVVAVGIGSKMPAKKWFPSRFKELSLTLLGRFPDAAIVIVGGSEDAEQGAALADEVGTGRAINTAGRTNIIQSAELLSRCVAYVGNDTGTMHLAAAVGTPCVAIFSARDNPGRWEPYGDRHTVLRHDVACAGCMLHQCTTMQMKCLDLITVREVWEALEEKLRRQSGTRPKSPDGL